MFPILKKFSNLFIVLAAISLICSVCVLVFLTETELQFLQNLEQSPFVLFSLIFTIFTGSILFTCLAIAFRILHQDLGNASYATSKRISDLKRER